ncbi:MAG TPA: folylpolyglutamate synthase/dihydrofolate synthase family protein [Vicinamibacteria bacterium]|nr:folylpolyglutamate synthase/dihydrofolate synthase family protein [Vicinamibacteria bacterium]
MTDGSHELYQQALRYLKGRERYGIKFGLHNIGRLMEALGCPERDFESVLIAGTNGKGSTAALLESILRNAGRRTGRYTSPHIRHVEERIALQGQPIPRSELGSAVGRVAEAAAALWPDDAAAPTFFEALTAAAFVVFAGHRVEIAVLEVGMGGRYDATNVVPARLSIVTTIGYDHERFLGSTLASIASEKAAIIKEGRPVVVGRLVPEALRVVREEARRKRATVIEAVREVETEAVEELAGGQRVTLRTEQNDYGSLVVPLSGLHQLDNLAVALRAAEVACLPGILDKEAVREGIKGARWPGRLERIAGRPPILLDAAHNVQAVDALVRYLEQHPHPRRVLLFGVMKDKRVFEMLSRLLPHVAYLVASRPAMSRSRGPEPLSRWAAEQGTSAEAIRSSSAALSRARELAGPDGEILVAGSIFLLGEIAAWLEQERKALAPA